VFDLNGKVWTNTGVTGRIGGRAAPTMAAFNGNVVLFGGYDPTWNAAGNTWLWNGTTWTKLNPSGSQPPARAAAVMVAR
jgi:hypothetical protein